MGHCIQAIIAPSKTADTISSEWPELPRLDTDSGFSIFPVDAARIDERIEPDVNPDVVDNEFMQLTSGFRSFLRTLSRGGELAYIETEYFGGIGGQGAVLFRDGIEVMPPVWQESGTINQALKLLGLKRGTISDEFTSVGLGRVRNNDDLIEKVDFRRKG